MTKFDPKVKDELVAKIALRVAASPRLASNWQSLSIVFTFGDGSLSNFGYFYTGEGENDWRAFTTPSIAIEDDLTALRRAMKDESGTEWHQGLCQLIRDRREMKFEFTYNGEVRWQVTPRNLKTMVQALRPRP